MPAGRLRTYKKVIEKNLADNGIRTVPLSKLKYLNPVAAQIKRELGKDFRVLSITNAKKGAFRQEGIESLIFSKKYSDYVIRRKNGEVDIKDFLVSVTRYPGQKSLNIRINSKMGDLEYTPELVIKVKHTVEEVLKSRGIGFDKQSKSFYTNRGLNFTFPEIEGMYGDHTRSKMARAVMSKLPQKRFTTIVTGKFKENHIPYHR